MKKLLLLLAFALSTSSTIFAEEVEIEGLWYSLSETTAEVIKKNIVYSGEIVIPETITYNETEYSVSSIGKRAFYGCNGLTSIIIPNSVTSIGENAFASCRGLTSINIPNSVTSIGEYAFNGCNGLTSIIIPNNVTSIMKGTFLNCSGLTSITIPNNVTSIEKFAFNGCSNLPSITIPNSVISIGEIAFPNCSGLTSIVVEEGNSHYDSRNNCNAIIETASNTLIVGCKGTIIPNSVTSIGYGAFQGSGLTSITIPNSVTSIGDQSFFACSSLTSITIPNSVTIISNSAFGGCSGLTAIDVEEGNTNYDSRNNCNAIIETSSNTLYVGCQNSKIPNSVMSIGDRAFYECSSLTSIVIPSSVTTIGNFAFRECSGLTSIKIPNSVNSLGYEAFSYCYGLSSISIPNSVTTIGHDAFFECHSLTSITIPSSVTTIGSQTFSGCTGLTSVTISNSLTTIGDRAFQSCHGLTSIKIPHSVTSIGASSFAYCNHMTDVYCFAETIASVGSNAFYETPISNITLHVPSTSVATYEATEPWTGFGEIVALSSMDVPNQKIGLDGTTTVEIDLNNYETNFVAFQMDLTLPEGVGIDKTGCSLSSRITDENQELTIGKLESGDYRITSTSLSLTPISGNEGTLLTLKLTAAEDFEGGQATISNIRFSTAESLKVTMSDETFDIDILKKYKLRYIVDGQEYLTEEVTETTPLTPADEPTREGYTFGGWSEVPETMPDHDVVITGRFYLFGDVNTDEVVDVVDVVDIARFVVATPSANFREKLADLNKDLTVNIADAVVLVNHIAGDQDFAMAPSIASYDYNQCKLQLLSNGTNTLSLCLSGDAEFTAFQFDMELPENSEITTIKINGQRMSGHQLLYNKVGDNCYRVAVLSLSNAVFKGREGELLNISIDGLATDGISIHDIHFVTKAAIDVTFDTISHCETTGIDNINASEDYNEVYDLQGRKLSKIQRGVNIIRSHGERTQGKKVLVNR